MIMKIEKLAEQTESPEMEFEYYQIESFTRADELLYCIIDGEDEYEFLTDGMFDHKQHTDESPLEQTPYIKVEFLTDQGFVLDSMEYVK